MCGPGPCTRCYFGISNCKYFKNFTLKSLRTRLSFLTENQLFFPAMLLWRPPSSVKPRPGVWRRSSRTMESEQFSLSLPPSPGRHSANLLQSTCLFDRKIWGVRWHERGSMSNTHDVSRSISQRIGVILYGLQTIVTPGGVPTAVSYAASRSLLREQGLCK